MYHLSGLIVNKDNKPAINTGNYIQLYSIPLKLIKPPSDKQGPSTVKTKQKGYGELVVLFMLAVVVLAVIYAVQNTSETTEKQAEAIKALEKRVEKIEKDNDMVNKRWDTWLNNLPMEEPKK